MLKTRKRIKYIVTILYSSQYCIQIVWNLFRKQQQTKQNKTRQKTKTKTVKINNHAFWFTAEEISSELRMG